MDKLKISKAQPKDTKLILDFIYALAKYEKMTHRVLVTEERLHQALFIEHAAKVLIAYLDDKPIGFAVYYPIFSTFSGKVNFYLEDIFINPEQRHKGYGKKLLQSVIEDVKNQGAETLKWSCLKWNQSAIDFYLKLGAKVDETWDYLTLDLKNL